METRNPILKSSAEISNLMGNPILIASSLLAALITHSSAKVNCSPEKAAEATATFLYEEGLYYTLEPTEKRLREYLEHLYSVFAPNLDNFSRDDYVYNLKEIFKAAKHSDNLNYFRIKRQYADFIKTYDKNYISLSVCIFTAVLKKYFPIPFAHESNEDVLMIKGGILQREQELKDRVLPSTKESIDKLIYELTGVLPPSGIEECYEAAFSVIEVSEGIPLCEILFDAYVKLYAVTNNLEPLLGYE